MEYKINGVTVKVSHVMLPNGVRAKTANLADGVDLVFDDVNGFFVNEKSTIEQILASYNKTAAEFRPRLEIDRLQSVNADLAERIKDAQADQKRATEAMDKQRDIIDKLRARLRVIGKLAHEI